MESVQTYTSLCMSIGDSSPPLKKGENKRTEKSTGIFIDLVSLRDLSQRSCRQDSCCYLAAKLGSWSQLRIAENCFWAGDSRQSTHTIQDSSLSFSSIFISGCLWVCLWVELFFLYYFCFGGIMDCIRSWLNLVFLIQFLQFYEVVFLWNDEWQKCKVSWILKLCCTRFIFISVLCGGFKETAESLLWESEDCKGWQKKRGKLLGERGRQVECFHTRHNGIVLVVFVGAWLYTLWYYTFALFNINARNKLHILNL